MNEKYMMLNTKKKMNFWILTFQPQLLNDFWLMSEGSTVPENCAQQTVPGAGLKFSGAVTW